MKKKVRLLLLTFLLAVSYVLPVCAVGNTDFGSLVTYSDNGYYEVYNNMICFCYYNSAGTITVGTSMNGQTVMINYKVYTDNSNIGSGGNAGVGSTTMTFTVSPDIEYIVITHSAPELGISKSYTLYF